MSEKSVKERPKWGSKVEFILSCLGYAVGLGNVWRFPYLAGRNGGAAFLIPYFIMMIFAGFPIFYLELAIGQYASLTPHMLYRRMSPIFAGIGYTMIMTSIFTGIYYNMIIAWSMYYLGASFKGIVGHLPWRYCDNSWNDALCYDDKIASKCFDPTPVYYQGECITRIVADNITIEGNYTAADFSRDMKMALSKRQTPSQQYNKFMLGEADGIDELGWPKLDLVLALFLAWVLVFFCLIKGIKSSGKVVYFTATFPYVLLLILLIRGNLMDGSEDGVNFFIYPNMSLLSQSSVWVDAAQQIFFSLSLGGGGLTTLASYNDFHNNLLRDTFIVVLGNCGTSILAGFTIFPIIGYIAKSVYPNVPAQQRVAEFARSGTTLAFIAYPDALDRMPWPWLWCILFFFMLILLGIDSQLVIIEVLNTSIIDQFPRLRPFKRKIWVIASICFGSFLVGLILTTPIGSYTVTLVDTFAGGLPLVFACLVEVCMVSYVYGYRRLIGNIHQMMGLPPNTCWKLLGYPVNAYWWICWISITPALLFGSLIMLLFNYSRTTQGMYVFPIWAELLGWGVTLICIIWIPLIAQYKLCISANWHQLSQPTIEWGQDEKQSKDLEMATGPWVQNRGYYNVSPTGHSISDGKPFSVSIHPGDQERLRRFHQEHFYPVDDTIHDGRVFSQRLN